MTSEARVGDFVRLQRGTTYQGILVGKPGPALLGLGSIVPGGGFRDDYKTYGGDCPPELTLWPGDLFVSLKGATKDGKMIGSVARVPSKVERGRLTQDTVKLIFHERDAAFEQYLYWLLRTPHYRDYCSARATGSAVVALSRDDFLSYPVPFLTPARRHIVALLEAVEAKMVQSRSLSDTLEAITRALFKSWFVDFDPVHAKAEGRALSGMDAATAALFPSEFDNSALGLHPRGWQIGPLSMWADALSGGTPSDSALWNGSLKWITPKSMTSLHADHCDDTVTETAVGRGTRLAPKGATLVMVRGMGLHDGVRVSQAREPLTFNQDVKALVSRDIEPDLLFFAMLVAQRDLHGRVEMAGHGTGKLSTDILTAYPVSMPKRETQQRLVVHFTALNDRIATNRVESRTLAELRDELVPRLLSGALSVAAADWAVEDAG